MKNMWERRDYNGWYRVIQRVSYIWEKKYWSWIIAYLSELDKLENYNMGKYKVVIWKKRNRL